jgi:hypothetical protein
MSIRRNSFTSSNLVDFYEYTNGEHKENIFTIQTNIAMLDQAAKELEKLNSVGMVILKLRDKPVKKLKAWFC